LSRIVFIGLDFDVINAYRQL